MKIFNPSLQSTEISGSVSLTDSATGSILAELTSSLDNIYANLSTFNSYTSSNDITNSTQTDRIDQLSVETGSLGGRVTNLELYTELVNNKFSTLATYTGSNDTTNTTQNNRLDGLSTFSGSANDRLDNLESFSGSANQKFDTIATYTSSVDNKFNTLATYTGSNDTTNTTQNNRLDALSTFSGSANDRINNVESFSGSINTKFDTLSTYTSSVDNKFNTLATYTGSNDTTNTTQNNRLDQLSTASGSVIGRLNNIETFSGSANIRLTNLESTTSSLNLQISDIHTYTSSLRTAFTASGATVLFQTGSVGTPSISVTGDTNTGIYFPAEDTIALVEGGNQALTINSLGTVVTSGSLVVSGSLLVQRAEERIVTASIAATGTINYNVLSQSVLYYTANATNNWTLNLRGDASNTLNNIMQTGRSMTVVFMVTNGATPYKQTALQIDGSTVTPRWQGGAQASGSANSVDSYTVVVMKTDNARYSVFESITQFK